MDRRSELRVNLNDTIQYRILYAGEYKTGIVRNISIHGAFLLLKEDLAVGSKLELVVGSHNKLEHVYMRVARIEETDHEGYTGYGCRIEMKVSEDS